MIFAAFSDGKRRRAGGYWHEVTPPLLLHQWGLPPDNPQISEALEIVEESGLNDAERAAYEGFWDRVSIEATKKAYMDKAIAERDAANARADAAEAKMRQDKLDTARQMKADGLPMETIAKYTGLAAGEIKAL